MGLKVLNDEKIPAVRRGIFQLNVKHFFRKNQKFISLFR